MQSRLYRSRNERMISGVCGGLGHYFGIDPTFVRLFFVVLTIMDGIGLLVYLALIILMPEAPEGEEPSLEVKPLMGNADAGKILGGALVILGGILFIGTLNLPWLNWFDFDNLWPILLILGGGAMLFRAGRGDE